MKYIPGKEVGIADILSRCPLSNTKKDGDIEENLEACIISYVQTVMDYIPFSNQKLSEIVELQNKDFICAKLKAFSKQGWPGKDKITPDIKDYWQARNEIAVENGLLMKGSRLILYLKSYVIIFLIESTMDIKE